MRTIAFLALALLLTGCCGLSDKGCPGAGPQPCGTGVCHGGYP